MAIAQPTASDTLKSPVPDRGTALVLVLIFVLGEVLIAAAAGARQSALFLIGGVMGVTLFHAAFGFTGGWRRFSVQRRGRAIRAQMLMIAVAALFFIPLLKLGTFAGHPLAGAFAPVGVSVLVGAAMFGFGMQLGGGCGSGTLFTVGGGSARMLVTLAGFVAGALIGTAHLPWWLSLPSLPPVNLGASLGAAGGLAVTLAGLGLVALLTVLIERRAHGNLEQAPRPDTAGIARLLHGPWPLIGAGIVLALANVATLLVAGHTWSITFGFGLWGAKIAEAVGVPVSDWAFWQWPGPAKALSASVLDDTVSVMNFGILVGSAVAASLAGKFAPKAGLPLLSLTAAILGGLLMGYGARLSFGCNIGALFSGIASGSLHGWLWFATAFGGSLAGIAIRPLFGLDGFRK
ncbi:YeeE/YedE family protein [uncultured Martelella sp.]|uniref:YeeE/YedE family protein n=1 Tax=uncultured Martelella sp. TaxID=392331 RepID=UPI0029C802A3|nr:YeeE/YedE family protein [uncultured Martelella sp.]